MTWAELIGPIDPDGEGVKINHTYRSTTSNSVKIQNFLQDLRTLRTARKFEFREMPKDSDEIISPKLIEETETFVNI